MDVLITHVYDKCRFKHFFHILLKLPSNSTLIDKTIHCINSGKPIRVGNLPECDVRYLQRPHMEYGKYLVATCKPICTLKIL